MGDENLISFAQLLGRAGAWCSEFVIIAYTVMIMKEMSVWRFYGLCHEMKAEDCIVKDLFDHGAVQVQGGMIVTGLEP